MDNIGTTWGPSRRQADYEGTMYFIFMPICMSLYGKGGSAHAVMYDRKKFKSLDRTQKNIKINILLH